MEAGDRAAIAEAVRRAESRTAGEIVVVIERAASQYRSLSIVLALVAALLVPWPLIGLTMVSAPRIFLIQLLCAVALLATLLWRGSGSRFVPGFLKRRRAHQAALREFTARGLTRTRDRTGVLLYVALQERYAEVLADVAIEQRIDAARWRTIIDPLVTEAAAGRTTEGLIAAVDAIGAILAEHAPPIPGDTDELPNNVILL